MNNLNESPDGLVLGGLRYKCVNSLEKISGYVIVITLGIYRMFFFCRLRSYPRYASVNTGRGADVNLLVLLY